MKSNWIPSTVVPAIKKLRAPRKFIARIPYENSRTDLLELLAEKPYLKPKAVCRELGWTPQKLAGVMKTSKGEFVYGMVVVHKK